MLDAGERAGFQIPRSVNRYRSPPAVLAHLEMAALDPDEFPSGFLQPGENLLPVHEWNDISNKIGGRFASMESMEFPENLGTHRKRRSWEFVDALQPAFRNSRGICAGTPGPLRIPTESIDSRRFAH